MIYLISHCEISGLYPSSILKEHNVSENDSVSVVMIKIGEVPLQTGQLQRGNTELTDSFPFVHT